MKNIQTLHKESVQFEILQIYIHQDKLKKDYSNNLSLTHKDHQEELILNNLTENLILQL
jgi:rRNA maturation protein Rpf1